MSERHGNVIVADGEARASDILALVDLVKAQVRESQGVTLEEEIERWA